MYSSRLVLPWCTPPSRTTAMTDDVVEGGLGMAVLGACPQQSLVFLLG